MVDINGDVPTTDHAFTGEPFESFRGAAAATTKRITLGYMRLGKAIFRSAFARAKTPLLCLRGRIAFELAATECAVLDRSFCELDAELWGREIFSATHTLAFSRAIFAATRPFQYRSA